LTTPTGLQRQLDTVVGERTEKRAAHAGEVKTLQLAHATQLANLEQSLKSVFFLPLPLSCNPLPANLCVLI
jgi:hypothetical protein